MPAVGGGQVFSDLAVVGRTAIANYERATRRPDIDEAIKICAATGVPMDWIYTGNLACFLPAHLAARIRAIEEAGDKSQIRSSA